MPNIEISLLAFHIDSQKNNSELEVSIDIRTLSF